MADEPDNLVLVQLRDMRAELQTITAKLIEHDGRFDRLEKKFDDMRGYLNHALGMGVTGHLKNEEQDARLDESVARQKRMDALMAELERRLGGPETPRPV